MKRLAAPRPNRSWQISVLGTVGAYARIIHVAIVGGTGRYTGPPTRARR
jgi:hypothetical protein